MLKNEFTIINLSLFTFVGTNAKQVNIDYTTIKNNQVSGRYFPPEKLTEILESYKTDFEISVAGESEQGHPIYSVQIGTGDYRILIWSQMHGNESTTTKALIDFFSFLKQNTLWQKTCLKFFTFQIIPMLNPDGSALYTRENANRVDLNRDALLKTQKESRVLHKVFTVFNPDLCLNMHDQRTIFSAGGSDNPATISFLAPAADTEKKLTPSRIRAMQLITVMYSVLKPMLPAKIGRFDDTFNPNCTGDSFQAAGVPTILIEAGHYPGDYQREQTRKFVFRALAGLTDYLCFDKDLRNIDYSAYFNIPENRKNRCDVLIANAIHKNYQKPVSIAVQLEEKLENGNINFHPKVVDISYNSTFYGNKTIDAQLGKTEGENGEDIQLGMILRKIKLNGAIKLVF